MADRKQDELDSMLDAVLAKYAAAEPRAGLEDRILANLQAERDRVPNRAWWRWSVAGALAALLVVVLALAWRSSRPPHPAIANHSSTAPQVAKQPATPIVATGGGNEVRGNQAQRQERATLRRSAMHRARPEAIASANPKLDQFPSPRPLSEQEKILLDYVERFPEEAVRIAEAQTALAQREELEMYSPPATQTKPQDHEKTE
jgi:hypothetical protein